MKKDPPGSRRVVLGTLLRRITVVLVVFTVAVYVGIFARTRSLAFETVEEQARTVVRLIVQTRAWNSQYGGVYVEKRPGVSSNPYLVELGVDPDLECGDGTVYTLRNPALMTQEISELVAQGVDVRFHLTSLDPTNPDHQPDDWESDRLREFEAGAMEAGAVIQDESPVYRYMVPLFVEESCLNCHARQGYELGEVRGAVSVAIPVDDLQEQLRLNAIGLAGLSALTVFAIVGIVYAMGARVVGRLEEAEHQLEHLAVTDGLTELWNRRYMMRRLKNEFDRSRRQGHDLGLIMLDLDHFKSVNDDFGHAFGDHVLRAAAARMRAAIRDYDVLGRFGGEEFLLIAPETDSEGVQALAERARSAISAEPIFGPGGETVVTASAGAAMLDQRDPTPDALLARSDAALYAAKRTGRDRVVMGSRMEDADRG